MLKKFVGKLAVKWYQYILNILITYAISVAVVIGSLKLHMKLFFTYLQFGPYGFEPSPLYKILTKVIETPFWEEFAFRVFPIQLVLCLSKVLGKQFSDIFLPYVIILSSIMFGWGHGGVEYVYAQGIAGLLLCRLYLKNNLNYWSIVAVHMMWNITAFFVNL